MTQEPIPYPEHTGSLCQQKMSITVRTKQVSTVLVPSEQVWAPSAAFSPSVLQQMEHCKIKMTHSATATLKLLRGAKHMIFSADLPY